MDHLEEGVELIKKSKNIWIMADSKKESVVSGLSLFYSLKKLLKDVNIFLEKVPEEVKFLIPSLNFLNYPTKVNISINAKDAKIKEVEYQKDEDSLIFSLLLEDGFLKRQSFALHWEYASPELVIISGRNAIKNYQVLNPFLKKEKGPAFLELEELSLSEKDASVIETVIKIIKALDTNLFDEDVSSCLLAGLLLSSENFLKPESLSSSLENAIFLIKKKADWQKIIKNL